MKNLTIIAAVAQNGAIGYKGGLIYKLAADMQHFRRATMGHTVLMGRLTFESLPKGALPHRRNMVLTRSKSFSAEGVERFSSMADALAATMPDEEVYVIGGASLYAEAMAWATRLLITHVEHTPKDADVFFPHIDEQTWHCVAREYHAADADNEQAFVIAEYEKTDDTE